MSFEKAAKLKKETISYHATIMWQYQRKYNTARPAWKVALHNKCVFLLMIIQCDHPTGIKWFAV